MPRPPASSPRPRLLLAELGELAVYIDGPLDADQAARIRAAWRRIERFILPSLRDVLRAGIEPAPAPFTPVRVSIAPRTIAPDTS